MAPKKQHKAEHNNKPSPKRGKKRTAAEREKENGPSPEKEPPFIPAQDSSSEEEP